MKNKTLVIISLVLTSIVLTLVFAVLSQTSNISSATAVAPSVLDFKVTIYGMKDENSANQFKETKTYESDDLSTIMSVPSAPEKKDITASIAYIDNNTYTISNIMVNLIEPDSEISYFFIIKNEGKSDDYLDLSKYKYINNKYLLVNHGICSSAYETSQDLLGPICPQIVNEISISSSDGLQITGSNNIARIPKEDYIIMKYVVRYKRIANKVEEPLSAELLPEKLIFSTTK